MLNEEESDRGTRPQKQVRVPVMVTTSQRLQRATITHISTDELGVDGAIGLYPGDEITLETVGGRRLSGEVTWWLMSSCGVRLSRTLARDDPLFERTVA